LTSQPLPFLHLALPLLDETEYLPRLLACIGNQSYRNFKLWVCINQPDEWWDIPAFHGKCISNEKSFELIRQSGIADVEVIDRFTRGHGWKGKRHGVGWARKELMDSINRSAHSDDIIVSIDGDVTFSKEYLSSIAVNFTKNPDAVGLAVPYFHNAVAEQAAYRAILRYEIYMRVYSLNLWRIRSPYTFTALGSAMACPVWAYRAIGGMTPKMSGEDFYFLQKLRKYGRLLFFNEEKVYPEARFSDRVYFGTGPAMIKGDQGDWNSYPVYPFHFFDEIAETTQLFSMFYRKTEQTRLVSFIMNLTKEEDPFRPLRENASEINQFIRFCHEKIDGLRILQYLKSRHQEEPQDDEEALQEFITTFFGSQVSEELGINEKFSFANLELEKLEVIRCFLVKEEEKYQVRSVLS
jgi:hypothetical protein